MFKFLFNFSFLFREAWTLSNALSLGVTQDLVIDPQHNWLATGSSRGFLCVWDLRYGVPLRTWRHPDGSKIHKLLWCGGGSGGECYILFYVVCFVCVRVQVCMCIYAYFCVCVGSEITCLVSKIHKLLR